MTTQNFNFDLLEEDGSEQEPEKTHNAAIKSVDTKLKAVSDVANTVTSKMDKNDGFTHVAHFHDPVVPQDIKIITPFTNISRMISVKIEGSNGGYTRPFSALLSFYYFDDAIYLPKILWAGVDAAPEISVGVENGVFTVHIASLGSYPSFDVYLRTGTYGTSRDDLVGWSVVKSAKEIDNASYVSVAKATVLHTSNTLIDPTTGCYAPI